MRTRPITTLLTALTVTGLTVAALAVAAPASATPSPAAGSAPVTAAATGLPPRSVWLADVDKVTAKASAYLAKRLATPGRTMPAIVLDIDNTSLQSTYGGSLLAPAVPSVLALARQARKQGAAVFFVTARPSILDGPSLANLHLEGFPIDGLRTQDTLAFLLDSSPAAFAAYKTNTRRAIERSGYTIVANIGNSSTDLSGGYAQRTFKLPDYAGALN